MLIGITLIETWHVEHNEQKHFSKFHSKIQKS